MFFVQVAADIFNNKVNFELSFPHRPTILEVTRATEAAFSNEIALRRPENVPPHNFHVAKIKVYDEEKSKWVDLVSEGQLLDYCQLYAFQPENPWHKESQKEIPAAVKPPTSAQRYPVNNSNAGAVVTAATPSTAARGATNGGSAQGALAPYTGSRTPGGQRGEPQSGRRASIQTNTSGALIPKVPVEATQEEKVRILFAELDVKGNRVLELEDFKHGFRTFNLDFSAATVEDLFEKADTNRDGTISFSEFERFARLYPIMSDCLYFRSKAFWDEEQLKREIEAERLAVRQAEQAVEAARKAVEDAEQDVDASKAAVIAAEADLKDRTDRLRDLTRDMDNAKREKERAIREKKEREKELLDVKEREKELRKAAQEVARDAEKLERRAAALDGEAAGADDKVRQLEKALDEARRAAERARQAAEQAARDAAVGKERARDATKDADEAARDVPRAEDAVRAAERNVAAADHNARELEGMGRDFSREAEEAALRRDQSERAVEEAKGRLRAKEHQLDDVKHQVGEREQAARQKEAELDEQRKQRELVSQHERALIEQELRLREQRDSLEERETKLMSEASSFLGNLRTHLQGGRSYSRD
ncbi:EF-hand domain [Trypanosoma melophagium]|uniref:EF-hand domain n=1 Tax=Trypanosoma melophagium TaxID=715481 RepID=UPI00351A2F3F|nr:EF-hand domain [Trypanosoma melophagium]